MPSYPSPSQRGRILPRHRVALMASAMAVTGALLFAAPGGQLNLGPAPAIAQTQTVQAHGPAGFAEIVQKVKPAVVSVRVKLKNQVSSSDSTSGDSKDQAPSFPKGSPFERFFREFGWPNQPNGRTLRPFTMAQGSGFFISADGYAVTNNHVVNNADSVEITTDAGKSYTAKVIGSDEKTDLALIKVDGASDFPYVKFADGTPRVGDWVIAVGNPYGLGGTVTAGIVSAHGRNINEAPYDDFLQIDAPINPGNSGGPLFNESGQVVGIDTAIYSPSGGSVGIGFAIPSNVARTIVAQLRDHGKVARGWLGVQMQPLTPTLARAAGLPNDQGVVVNAVVDGSPAAHASLQQGDVITAFNGKPIKDARDLALAVAGIQSGKIASLTVWRNDHSRSVNVSIGTEEKTPIEG